MLYIWLYPFHTDYSFLNVFRYLSFRIIYAAVTAFLIAFVFAPWLIKKLQHIKLGQQIRDDGPKRHLAKSGTPTMGGLLIIFAVLLSTLLWADVTKPYVWLVMIATLGFGAIGFTETPQVHETRSKTSAAQSSALKWRRVADRGRALLIPDTPRNGSRSARTSCRTRRFYVLFVSW